MFFTVFAAQKLAATKLTDVCLHAGIKKTIDMESLTFVAINHRPVGPFISFDATRRLVWLGLICFKSQVYFAA